MNVALAADLFQNYLAICLVVSLLSFGFAYVRVKRRWHSLIAILPALLYVLGYALSRAIGIDLYHSVLLAGWTCPFLGVAVTIFVVWIAGERPTD